MSSVTALPERIMEQVHGIDVSWMTHHGSPKGEEAMTAFLQREMQKTMLTIGPSCRPSTNTPFNFPCAFGPFSQRHQSLEPSQGLA